MKKFAILILIISASFMGCTKNKPLAKSSSVDVLPHISVHEFTETAPASRGIASAPSSDFSAKAMAAMKAIKNCFHQSSGKSLFINTRNPKGFMLEADVTCTGETARTLRNKLAEVDSKVNFQLSRSPNSEQIFFGKKEIVSNKTSRGIATLSGADYTFKGSSCTKELPNIYSCELKFRMPLAERLEGLIKR